MRILLLMDPFIRVPPAHYGGIERVVADLAAGRTPAVPLEGFTLH